MFNTVFLHSTLGILQGGLLFLSKSIWNRQNSQPALHYPLMKADSSRESLRPKASPPKRGPIKLLIRFAKSSVHEKADAHTVS